MSIHKKLFEIQKNIGKLTKDSDNPFFKSKYADINQLIELTNPLFHEAGLMVLQPIAGNALKTQIFDVETNEVIESSLDLPQGNDPQKIGSAITYYRRYTLKALLNLQEEDDDGNKGANKNPNGSAEPEDKKPWMTEIQFNSYLALINKGEKWMSKLSNKLNMKKVYRETLQSAETKYKPKT
ncbi:ERF family protein [Sphingobacterium faecium]|uniref:ERF family protein n=1 Tax=Sphingobacterium faecium TaxID=34087 RepID=UPI002468B0B5|nr:ERF family protein [Sphingobacterium faecium]MDH5825808.1 ERF family protein [Sphingobacterium faecium]